MSERKPILSIIITVFMSEENLKESFPRIIGLRDQIPDFELEFISLRTTR